MAGLTGNKKPGIARKAFRHRVEKARSRLFRTAYAWSHRHDIADDLTQETLAKALSRAGQLRDPNALEAWLFKIMANLWRDYVRREGVLEVLEDQDRLIQTEDSPERLSARNETIQQVRRAVKSLPENYRLTVTLVDLEGFSYTEAAEILEVPVGTIMSRLSRARQRLRRSLSRLGVQDTKPYATRVRRVK